MGAPLPLAILREGLTLFVTQADLKPTTDNLIFASYSVFPSSQLTRQLAPSGPLLVSQHKQLLGTDSTLNSICLAQCLALHTDQITTWVTSGLPDSSYKAPFYQQHLKNGPTSLAE